MRQTFSYRQKAGTFFAVLLPILVTQLALVSTGFCDTVMAGHVSEQDLAGVAVAVNLFFPVFTTCLGVVSGLTPAIAQYNGAGRRQEIVFAVRQGFYWALAIAVLFVAGGFLAVPPVLRFLDLEPRVAYVAAYYLAAVAAGILPVFMAAVLRNFIDALGATRLTMCITIVTVPVNIIMNYIFIFGAFGVPAFGGIGAGIGTAIAYFSNMVLNGLVVWRMEPFRSYGIFREISRPCLAEWRRQLGLGVPIGATMFCEASIFSAVGLFMTVYGTGVMAAHQAALNFSTMVYMLPLSVSMALTILTGYELGAGRPQDAWRYSRLGRLLSFVFVAAVALILVQFRSAVAALYTNDDFVQRLLQIFLLYAVGMQVADSINAPLQGTLRGARDVRVTFFLAVLSYWVIGLPVGWFLAHRMLLTPYGFWIGLITGLLAGAVLLMLRLSAVERRYREKTEMDKKLANIGKK